MNIYNFLLSLYNKRKKKMMENKELLLNQNHWAKVRSERRRRNKENGTNYTTFEKLYPDNGRIYGHELEGQKFYEKDTNQEYTIDHVCKHWYHGWYLIVVVYKYYELSENSPFDYEIINGKKYGRSHGTRMWENINCIHDVILDSIEENKKNIILL